MGDGPIWTEILSQRSAKPKTTNQPTYRQVETKGHSWGITIKTN